MSLPLDPVVLNELTAVYDSLYVMILPYFLNERTDSSLVQVHQHLLYDSRSRLVEEHDTVNDADYTNFSVLHLRVCRHLRR